MPAVPKDADRWDKSKVMIRVIFKCRHFVRFYYLVEKSLDFFYQLLFSIEMFFFFFAKDNL